MRRRGLSESGKREATGSTSWFSADLSAHKAGGRQDADVTARSFAQKVFQQYVGRTLSAAIVITVVVYFLGVPVLTIVCAVAAVLVALWWVYFLVNGPRRN